MEETLEELQKEALENLWYNHLLSQEKISEESLKGGISRRSLSNLRSPTSVNSSIFGTIFFGLYYRNYQAAVCTSLPSTLACSQ